MRTDPECASNPVAPFAASKQATAPPADLGYVHRGKQFLPFVHPVEALMQLQIRGLSKRDANGVQALDRLTLTIHPGMLGLPGPTGAGKSTRRRTRPTR